MTRVVAVAVEFIGARIRLDESTVRQAGFAEHSAVRDAALIGADMTAGHSRGDSIGIDPPGGFSLDPIVRLELNGSRRAGETLCANRGFAYSFGASESERQ